MTARRWTAEEAAFAGKARISHALTPAKPGKARKSTPSRPQPPKQARKPPRALSEAEETFAVQLRASGLLYTREFQFDANRKWRLDFIVGPFGGFCVAVEIMGWGRHQRFLGYAADCEKLSHAAIAGYRVILATPQQVKSGAALDWTKKALGL